MTVGTLYHYCSLDAFLNIIRNKSIRMSDIGKSNDFMEAKWLFEFFEEEVLHQYNEEPFINSNRVIYGLSDIDTLRFLIRNEKNKMINRNDELFYVTCFSEEGDVLSQWRGYADDGFGVSIGFDSEVLKTIASNEELLQLKKVVYPRSKELIHKEIKSHARSFLESVYYAISQGDTKDIYFNDYSLDSFYSVSTKALLQESLFYKNPAFQEEKEWRLVLNEELDKSSSEWEVWNYIEENTPESYFWERFPAGLQFRNTRSKLISFFDLSFKGFEQQIIKEIYIGPKSEVEENDMYQLLGYYGYQVLDEITVKKSKSTYR